MRNSLILIIATVTLANSAKAQQKWTLPQCVDYAMTNNITVRQTDLQTRLSELNYSQSKMGQYPTLSFSGGPGYNSGRNQDP